MGPGTIPIKPLVDKLSKPAAFTKPSATVTPTIKSTGVTVSSPWPIVGCSSSTKTVSTCTTAPSTTPVALTISSSIEKVEPSSTTCSPKLDSSGQPTIQEVTSSTGVQETDSDPNVTSTTKEPGNDLKDKSGKGKIESVVGKDPIKNIAMLKDKKDLKEDLLFAPTATIVQAIKPKVDKLKDWEKLKEKKMDIFNINKDVKRAKESLSGKEKLKSNKDTHKHKMKAKHENELKDFLSATATIKKEAKREKEEHRKDPERKDPEVRKEPE